MRIEDLAVELHKSGGEYSKAVANLTLAFESRGSPFLHQQHNKSKSARMQMSRCWSGPKMEY